MLVRLKLARRLKRATTLPPPPVVGHSSGSPPPPVPSWDQVHPPNVAIPPAFTDLWLLLSARYSDGGGSVLWSAGSAFIVCGLETARPPPASAVAGDVPGLCLLWDRGLTLGCSGDRVCVALGLFSPGVGFSKVCGDGGATGLFFSHVAGKAAFLSGLSVAAGGLSRTGRAANVSCGPRAAVDGRPGPRVSSSQPVLPGSASGSRFPPSPAGRTESERKRIYQRINALQLF